MEFSIPEIAKLLVKRLKTIIIITVLGAATFLGVNKYLIDPIYTASVQLYVNAYGNASNESLNELNYAQKVVNTYINFLRTKEFYRQVLEDTGLEYTTSQLEEMTNIETVDETEIFEISVTTEDAADSYDIVESMQKIAPKLIGQIKDNTRISVVDSVQLPEHASGPRVLFNTVFGGAASFIGSIILIIIQKMFDVNVKDKEELTAKYDLPLLGSIPSFIKEVQKKGILHASEIRRKKEKKDEDEIRVDHVINSQTNFVITEAYKSLRTNLRYLLRSEGCKTLLINSPTPGDGKSTTCANIAITIAQTGARVLVIDCDMRKGRIHKAFGLKNTVGISDLISGIQTESEVIQESKYENLHVITIGTIPPNPTELLSSVQMEEVMQSLRRYYDYILLDSPPVNIVSDAISLAKLVDGVLMIVKENYTTYPNIDTALSKYKLVEANILGFVLNDVTLSQGMKSKSNYYYYYENKHD